MSNRPLCPRCESNHIVSMGKKRWQCKDCRRVFRKTLEEIANFEPIIKRKSQPQKKPYVMKNPIKVQCAVCGKQVTIDNPNSETGLFYCTECLKEYGGKTPNSKIEGYERMRIPVPRLEVD